MMADNGLTNITIKTDFERAKEIEDQIVAQAESLGYDEDSVFALRLSLAEALANAIRHGNCEDCSKTVDIRYQVTPELVEVFVSDQGCGFVPNQVPDPTLDENLENPSGRGIMLMRAYMNLVEYNPQGNEVHLVKFRKPH